MTTHQPALPTAGTSKVAAAPPDMIMIAVQPISCMTFAVENSFDPTLPNERPTACIALKPVSALTLATSQNNTPPIMCPTTMAVRP